MAATSTLTREEEERTHESLDRIEDTLDRIEALLDAILADTRESEKGK